MAVLRVKRESREAGVSRRSKKCFVPTGVRERFEEI